MPDARFLRDARHLNKFPFTLRRGLFYEPLDAYYEPSAELWAIVTQLLKKRVDHEWQVTRSAFWYYSHPRNQVLPLQGWKIHISATLSNCEAIMQRAAEILLRHNTSFKFALDMNTLAMMTHKRWPRGGSGKFITAYPMTQTSFGKLIEELYADLKTEQGPYILSDKRFRDCRVLYYRYGGLARNTQLHITGERVPILITPEGKTLPDVRTPFFSPPAWVTDPFPDSQNEPADELILSGRYRISGALAFSNSGGVYRAEDVLVGREVVIKEARPHTLMDVMGNNSVVLLQREQAILTALAGLHVGPKVLDSFQAWENHFLVEEYIDGVTVREVILTHSPLMRVAPSLRDSESYYDLFSALMRSLCRCLGTLHESNIVFGDLSATNLRVNLFTKEVVLIDFEAAVRVGVDTPTNLHTPGFKRPSASNAETHTIEDDHYSLASLMLYMMFPISSISALREDTYDRLLELVIRDIGWAHTKVFAAVRGLATGQITCARASELLSTPSSIVSPVFESSIEENECTCMVRDLGLFIIDHMRCQDEDTLVPVDPFAYETNPLSLGFGACGVLYALSKSGFPIPHCAHEWVERRLNSIKADDLAPGILTGLAGIALTLFDLGNPERAIGLISLANRSKLTNNHHSLFYGAAGVGMADLTAYHYLHHEHHLAEAVRLAELLLQTARVSEQGLYWTSGDIVHVGYGYGQAGVALFLLRLFEATGDERYWREGRRALDFDLSHAVETEPGVRSFPRTPGDSTMLPYLEEGTAGIAKVAMRYGLWEDVDIMLADVHRRYSGFAGLLYGLGSFVDVLTDAYVLSGNAKYLTMAKRPLSGLRDLHFLRFQGGAATPGDGLFRISCDYATGSAGIMRAVHRYVSHQHADFMLDEVPVHHQLTFKPSI